MKVLRLVWSVRAARDLRRIKTFIAYDKPEAALRLVETVKRKAERLKRFPKSGRIVPELSRSDIRELLIANYRIIYKVTAKQIYILTVFEGHRQGMEAS